MRLPLFFLVLLLACGGDDDGGEPAGGLARGAYFGDVTIGHDDPTRSVFAAAELELAADGVLAGTLTSKSPSSTVGEEGELSGQLVGDGPLGIAAELSIVFPTLGTFTLKGSMQYVEASRQLAGQLTARDAGGAVIGSAAIVVMQE